jgi:murein DD-endopeptidase MepM/ murein hydrolase activator NlpD
MVSLIISTGASNLILTRPSDSALADQPLVNASELSKATAKTEAVADTSVNEAGSTGEISAQLPIFSTVVTSAPLVLPLAQIVATAAQLQSARENQQPTGQMPPPAQVEANGVTHLSSRESLSSRVATVPSYNIPKQTTKQSKKLLQVLRVNKLIRQLKQSQVATTSKVDAVDHSQVASPVVIASSKPVLAEETLPVISETKSTWTAKQKLLLDRLKLSNRSQESLAELRFEESNTELRNVVANQQEETTNRESPTPFARAWQGNQPVEIYELVHSGTKLDLEQPQPPATVIVTLPKVVNQPTAVVPIPVVARDYQVKAGDTLTAIALRHRLPISELIQANHLGNPNRLQINQRITIPNSQSGSTVGQSIGLLKRPEQFGLIASIASNSASDSQPASLVPPQPVANTPSVNNAYSGMGGDISDDDSVQTNPPNIAQTQQAQSAAAKLALQSDLSVQNLHTDIQKLRQKYDNQSILTSQALPSANQTSTMPGTSSATSQPINPEFSANRAAKNLHSESPKSQTTVRSRVKARVATAPIGTDSAQSLQSLPEQNVSPALPPLGSIGTYLPKPTSISFKGYIWPTKGAVTSGYGWRWGRMHKGVDIAAPIGTPIMAAANGVVVKAGWNSGGYGNLVDIQHTDGTVTRYGHNKRILVHAGETVEQGQQISEMGSTGFSTGPHLHFEVHPLGKKAVNPIAYLPR